MIWWIVTLLLILGAPDTKVGERIFITSLVLYLVVIGFFLIIGLIQQPELLKKIKLLYELLGKTEIIKHFDYSRNVY